MKTTLIMILIVTAIILSAYIIISIYDYIKLCRWRENLRPYDDVRIYPGGQVKTVYTSLEDKHVMLYTKYPETHFMRIKRNKLYPPHKNKIEYIITHK